MPTWHGSEPPIGRPDPKSIRLAAAKRLDAMIQSVYGADAVRRQDDCAAAGVRRRAFVEGRSTTRCRRTGRRPTCKVDARKHRPGGTDWLVVRTQPSPAQREFPPTKSRPADRSTATESARQSGTSSGKLKPSTGRRSISWRIGGRTWQHGKQMPSKRLAAMTLTYCTLKRITRGKLPIVSGSSCGSTGPVMMSLLSIENLVVPAVLVDRVERKIGKVRIAAEECVDVVPRVGT